jgi:hypothetical protein
VRSDERQSGFRTPTVVAGHGDDRYPEAIPQSFGGDRLAGLLVQHGNQVRGGDEHVIAGASDQELVLEVDFERSSVERASAFDDRGATGETANRAARDITDDLLSVIGQRQYHQAKPTSRPGPDAGRRESLPFDGAGGPVRGRGTGGQDERSAGS